jgi:hypothetical protein
VTDANAWRALDAELRRWRVAGRTPRFWLRDDDAVEPTAALERLVGLTRAAGVPLALAVIPAHTGAPLAQELAGAAHVTVAVHGWSHANHAPEGAKKQELGAHRPAGVVCAELAESLAILAALHGEKVVPVLVPPWNRIDRALISRLPELGFVGLSVFGKPFAAPVAVVNSTVDIIDWHTTRGCSDHAVLASEIVAQLREAFDDQAAAPIGVLTHHLVHDDSAWDFLERLFETTALSGPGSWLALPSLVQTVR